MKSHYISSIHGHTVFLYLTTRKTQFLTEKQTLFYVLHPEIFIFGRYFMHEMGEVRGSDT